mgnify:CR=1 FL=1
MHTESVADERVLEAASKILSQTVTGSTKTRTFTTDAKKADLSRQLSHLSEQIQALEVLKGKHLIDQCKLILNNPLEVPAARLNAAVHLYPAATFRQIQKETGIRRKLLMQIVAMKHYPTNEEVRLINDFFLKNYNHYPVLI